MKSTRIVVLAIAVLAIGILVLPSTLTLFAGQHYWYDTQGSGNDIPCQKCHADVFEELEQSNFHVSMSGGTDKSADESDCAGCHRTDNLQYAESDGSVTKPGEQAHAASVVSCMLCHGVNATDTNMGPIAGGFNIDEYGVASDYDYSNGTYTGSDAAHNAFVAKAITDDTLQDSNEACVACHTHTAVKINFTHARTLSFDVGLEDFNTTESGMHNWTITNWDVNGSATATIYGNTTGDSATSNYNAWPGNVSGVNYTYD